MKIKRETDTQLILEDTPWLMSVVLVVMIVASVGMGLIFISMGLSADLMIFVIMGALAPVVTIVMCTMAMRVFVKRTQIIFDRAAGTITYRTRTMSGYTEVVHDLAHLEHAILKTSRDSDGRDLASGVLVLSGGMSAGEHSLTGISSTGPGPKNAVNAVNRWVENGKSA